MVALWILIEDPWPSPPLLHFILRPFLDSSRLRRSSSRINGWAFKPSGFFGSLPSIERTVLLFTKG
jgi:hypothetical protein